jgi:prepilin-type processing-associated H-X9-DG protein
MTTTTESQMQSPYRPVEKGEIVKYGQVIASRVFAPGGLFPMIIFLWNDSFAHRTFSPYMVDMGWASTTYIKFRHNGMVNVLFVDHMESVPERSGRWWVNGDLYRWNVQ